MHRTGPASAADSRDIRFALDPDVGYLIRERVPMLRDPYFPRFCKSNFKFEAL